jgi:hypothetical protein
MKIQCSCGMKYAFDVTADMLANPVRFVCENCGADQSESVNQIIWQQFGPPRNESVAESAAPLPAPEATPPKVRVQIHTPTAPLAASPAPAAEVHMCVKHPGQLATEHCRVCHKPLCPHCMTVFGYVCSAFCKHQAEERGLDVPVYAGQSTLVHTQRMRSAGRLVFGIAGGVALVLGAYFWYVFAGSRPRVVMSVQFSAPAFSGAAKLLGEEAALLHGGHLARYDLKTKKEIWGVDLIDTNQIAREAGEDAAKERAEIESWRKNRTGDDMGSVWRPRTENEIYRSLLASAQSEIALHARDSNLWLRTEGKLVQYDWASGKPGREVVLNGHVERTLLAQDSVLVFSETDEGEQLTKIHLSSGETNTQPLGERPKLVTALGKSNKLMLASASLRQTNSALSKTNVALARSRTSPAVPALTAYKVRQPDPLPARIAAPAIAAAAVRNAQIEKQLEDDTSLAMAGFGASSRKQFINDRGTLVEFSVKLLESKTVERQAMKAPPKKSALDGEVNQAATRAIANEIMNEWQRDRTGGVEQEDVSRYQITIKRTGSETPEWKAEVTGPPQFFALDTVDLLVAGQSLMVLDKSSKKLWESKLNFGIAEGFGEDDWGELIATASSPGVERDGLLYFFDKGVLTCFELATGNARWRQPTVGVTKVLSDEQGALYVDTTTGSAENLKYSQQIDIGDKSYPVILKLDAKTGKMLWRSERNGRLSHVFGKLVYTIEWHGGDDDEGPSPYKVGMEIPPHVRIRRLSAGNGKPMWEYYQKRAPLNVDIQKNVIQLVFKNEMQVLKFLAW